MRSSGEKKIEEEEKFRSALAVRTFNGSEAKQGST